jgi:hypothetical protein
MVIIQLSRCGLSTTCIEYHRTRCGASGLCQFLKWTWQFGVSFPHRLKYYTVNWTSTVNDVTSSKTVTRQQKRGGNFEFLSPVLFAFMNYILHMSFHIRKQGSIRNIP